LIAKRVRRALVFHLVHAVALVLGLLPRRAAVALGGWLGVLAYLLAPRERRRAHANLARVLPARSATERRALARAAARQLGRSALECLGLGRLRATLAEAQSPVTFTPGSRQALGAALAPGRGAIFATGHLGNWELMGAAVAAVAAPVGVLFKPSSDPRFTRFMERTRSAAGLVSIRVDRPGHLREAAALLRAGGVLGVMVDLPGGSRAQRASFLGQPHRPSRLLSVLARRTGAAVVAGSIRRSPTDPCQHAISIERLEGAPDALPGRALALLTRAILEDPSQWTWSLDAWRDLEPSSLAMSRGM
jgi:KDO2-lipid IV(A) lauroyltransferase